MVRGAILARPAKSEAAVTAPESGEPNSNSYRELRRSEGSARPTRRAP